MCFQLPVDQVAREVPVEMVGAEETAVLVATAEATAVEVRPALTALKDATGNQAKWEYSGKRVRFRNYHFS